MGFRLVVMSSGTKVLDIRATGILIMTHLWYPKVRGQHGNVSLRFFRPVGSQPRLNNRSFGPPSQRPISYKNICQASCSNGRLCVTTSFPWCKPIANLGCSLVQPMPEQEEWELSSWLFAPYTSHASWWIFAACLFVSACLLLVHPHK